MLLLGDTEKVKPGSQEDVFTSSRLCRETKNTKTLSACSLEGVMIFSKSTGPNTASCLKRNSLLTRHNFKGKRPDPVSKEIDYFI